jgi:glucosyl-3-phosphoglycerate synthase
MQAIDDRLKQEGIEVGEDGKGRSAWIAYGYILALENSHVIALQDCDIVMYDRELLARLCYPTAHPNIGFEFCKGYYSRVTDRLHGRVTRLFVSPLLRSLKATLGSNPFLDYLDSFRYILSGEFSMDVELARRLRIPGDRGIEVGVLAEVHRNCVLSRVCQVDLSDSHEHKHQPAADPGEPGSGAAQNGHGHRQVPVPQSGQPRVHPDVRVLHFAQVVLPAHRPGFYHPLRARFGHQRADL